jgi:hypothetical protein
MPNVRARCGQGATYALVCETLKFRGCIDEVLQLASLSQLVSVRRAASCAGCSDVSLPLSVSGLCPCLGCVRACVRLRLRHRQCVAEHTRVAVGCVHNAV